MPAKNERDTGSDADVELLKTGVSNTSKNFDGSKSADIWDVRQGLPPGIIGRSVLDIEADAGADAGAGARPEMTEFGDAGREQQSNQGGGVMKRVDVDVSSYQPEDSSMFYTGVQNRRM